MEKKQKNNWGLTCEFSVFAQAYTGLKRQDAIVENLIVDCAVWFAESGEFLNDDDLYDIWRENVSIQVNYVMENGITQLEMLSDTGKELGCDCVDLESLIIKIINIK